MGEIVQWIEKGAGDEQDELLEDERGVWKEDQRLAESL